MRKNQSKPYNGSIKLRKLRRLGCDDPFKEHHTIYYHVKPSVSFNELGVNNYYPDKNLKTLAQIEEIEKKQIGFRLRKTFQNTCLGFLVKPIPEDYFITDSISNRYQRTTRISDEDSDSESCSSEADGYGEESRKYKLKHYLRSHNHNKQEEQQELMLKKVREKFIKRYGSQEGLSDEQFDKIYLSFLKFQNKSVEKKGKEKRRKQRRREEGEGFEGKLINEIREEKKKDPKIVNFLERKREERLSFSSTDE